MNLEDSRHRCCYEVLHLDTCQRIFVEVVHVAIFALMLRPQATARVPVLHARQLKCETLGAPSDGSGWSRLCGSTSAASKRQFHRSYAACAAWEAIWRSHAALCSLALCVGKICHVRRTSRLCHHRLLHMRTCSMRPSDSGR